MKLSERVLSTEHGLLIRAAQASDQGLYYCLATENAFKRTVAKIRLRVLSPAMVALLSDTQPPAAAWGGAAAAPLAGFSPSESLAVQLYCKERRQLQDRDPGRPRPPGDVLPLRGDMAKLKPLLDRRKSRNRRNHLPGL